IEERRASVRLISRGASEPIEIQNPLETGDPFQLGGELGGLTTGNIDLASVLEIDRELAFVPVKSNWPTVSEINCLAVRERIGASLWLIDRTGIIVGKPHGLCAIGSNWRAREDQCKTSIGERAVSPRTPRRFDGCMMMLIANHQHTGRPAHC